MHRPSSAQPKLRAVVSRRRRHLAAACWAVHLVSVTLSAPTPRRFNLIQPIQPEKDAAMKEE